MSHNYSLYATGLVLCLVVAACAGSGIGDLWREHISPLNYAQLFQIALDLSSPDKADNIAGMDALVGPGNTQKLVTWYNASLIAIKAGKSILDRVQSRDLLVAQTVNIYKEQYGLIKD